MKRNSAGIPDWHGLKATGYVGFILLTAILVVSLLTTNFWAPCGWLREWDSLATLPVRCLDR